MLDNFSDVLQKDVENSHGQNVEAIRKFFETKKDTCIWNQKLLKFLGGKKEDRELGTHGTYLRQERLRETAA